MPVLSIIWINTLYEVISFLYIDEQIDNRWHILQMLHFYFKSASLRFFDNKQKQKSYALYQRIMLVVLYNQKLYIYAFSGKRIIRTLKRISAKSRILYQKFSVLLIITSYQFYDYFRLTVSYIDKATKNVFKKRFTYQPCK